MAMILTRQKDGSMKRQDTGMDLVMDGVRAAGGAAKKVVKAVASAPGKYVDAVIDANKRVDAAKAAKTNKDIERAFGSVENYNRINKRFPMP